MKIFKDCASFLEFTKGQIKTIGFVSTMGALQLGEAQLKCISLLAAIVLTDIGVG